MTRDELLKLVVALPADIEIGIGLDGSYVEIEGLTSWSDGEFAALVGHAADIQDLKREWAATRITAVSAGPAPQRANRSDSSRR